MKKFLLAIALLWSVSAEATTYYVSKSGNNGNSCTTAQSSGASAKLTIGGGIGCISGNDGDILIIQAGTYIENNTIGSSRSGGSWATATQIKAETPGTVIIMGYVGLGTTGNPISYVIFDGLINDGNFGVDAGAGAIGVAPVSVNEANHIRFTNGEVRNGRDHGINASGNAQSYFEILNMNVHHNGIKPDNTITCGVGGGNRSLCHGIYFDLNNHLVDGGTFHDNAGHCIHIYQGSASNVVRNIQCWNGFNGVGVYSISGGGDQVYNNVFWNIIEEAIVAASPKSIFANNTIYGSGAGIEVGSNQAASVFRNNIMSNTTAWIGTTGTFSNNLCSSAGTNCTYVESASSTFTNAATADFTLKGTSAAVNHGFDLSATFTTDKNGVTRPPGAWDIGAYEFGGVAPGSVAWSNTRTGGIGTSTTCCANWTISSIPLLAGLNPITVTATDSGGNTGTDQITVTYAPFFPGNTLAGSWPFNEGSGLTVLDSSGNANTGTLVNGAALTNAIHVHDKGISLDGVDAYMNVPDANSLDFTQSFTFSAWVTLPSVVGWQPLFAKGQTYNTSNWPVQFLYASGANNTTMDPACTSGSVQAGFVANGKDGPVNIVCAPPIPTNTPTHIAVTYDLSTLRLWKNGVNVVSKTIINNYMEPTSEPLIIGGDAYGDNLGGIVSSPRVYNWALNQVGTGGANKAFGDPCVYADASPGIIENANCAIIQPQPPVDIKIPAAPDALKIGAGAVVRFGARP